MRMSFVLLCSIFVGVAIYLLTTRGELNSDALRSRSTGEEVSEQGGESLARKSSIGKNRPTKSTSARIEGGDFDSVLPQGYHITAKNMTERRAEENAVLVTPNGDVLACGEISLSSDNSSVFLIGNITHFYPDTDIVTVNYRAVMKLKLSDESSTMTSESSIMTSSGSKRLPKSEAEQAVPSKSDRAGGSEIDG